jgi:hypothetical protein
MSRRISFWHKTVWRLARTPLIGVIKGAYRWRVRSQIAQRRKLAIALPADQQLQTLADQLNRDGFCILDGMIDMSLLQAVGAAGEQKYLRSAEAGRTQHVQHKDFWTRLLDEDKVDGTLPTDNPFVAFALQQNVLTLLAKAYGEIPLLDDVLLTLSRPTGKALALSQLWHRDYDDSRTIKMFIYLTDVRGRDDGPFTFLDGPVSDRLGSNFRSRRDDEEVDAKLRPGELREMVAPRFSVFMVETSRCLHMGSRINPGHERLLYTASYISVPRLYPEPPARFRLTGNESEVVRCLLTPAGADA